MPAKARRGRPPKVRAVGELFEVRVNEVPYRFLRYKDGRVRSVDTRLVKEAPAWVTKPDKGYARRLLMKALKEEATVS